MSSRAEDTKWFGPQILSSRVDRPQCEDPRRPERTSNPEHVEEIKKKDKRDEGTGYTS